MKKILMILALALCVFGQANENWNGYGDTSLVASFRADSLKYSKTFKLSSMENCRFDVYAADTGAAGFANDSVSFIWGIQTGHYAFTSASARVPTITWAQQLLVDTFTISSANCTPARMVLSSSQGYVYDQTLTTIDTSSVPGWAYQSRAVSPEWDQVYRFWFKGLTGNNVSGFLKLTAQAVRRIGVPVKH